MIFIAGQATLQTLVTAKVMSKIEKPRRTLLYKVSTNIKTAQRVVEEVAPHKAIPFRSWNFCWAPAMRRRPNSSVKA